MTLLKVRNLSVAFKLKKQLLNAVRDVSFDLNAGEILGIVGESGSGKSVTAKALVHLLPDHSTLITGEASYCGQNILTLREKELQNLRGKEIGMIFQDPMTSLNPTMRIGRQICESYLRHHKDATRQDARDTAVELLELVGIPQPKERFEEYPHTLSGGMRQRVMIAIALAAKPRIIIADEPTTALDVTIQAQILELMRSIKEKLGTSFILITHDLSVVAGFCDRVLVMYAGRVVEQAKVDDLFDLPAHPYTRGLLHAIPRLDMPSDHPLTPIEGTPPSLIEIGKGCSFCPRCPYALKICTEEDPTLHSIADDHQMACWRQKTDE